MNRNNEQQRDFTQEELTAMEEQFRGGLARILSSQADDSYDALRQFIVADLLSGSDIDGERHHGHARAKSRRSTK